MPGRARSRALSAARHFTKTCGSKSNSETKFFSLFFLSPFNKSAARSIPPAWKNGKNPGIESGLIYSGAALGFCPEED
jgi:hypothetical protein